MLRQLRQPEDVVDFINGLFLTLIGWLGTRHWGLTVRVMHFRSGWYLKRRVWDKEKKKWVKKITGA